MQKLYLFFVFDLSDNEFKKENISTGNIISRFIKLSVIKLNH